MSNLLRQKCGERISTPGPGPISSVLEYLENFPTESPLLPSCLRRALGHISSLELVEVCGESDGISDLLITKKFAMRN